MSAGTLTRARRVGSVDEIQRPGDYYYNPNASPEADGDVSLWFLLPTASADDPFGNRADSPHNGMHRIASPKWKITENPDGSVSAQPSIGCGKPPYYWHGYLDPGNTWRQV